ncbi:hypothetical protein P7C70_g8006, partial [Phenoliferia sp. Uapishka_3]
MSGPASGGLPAALDQYLNLDLLNDQQQPQPGGAAVAIAGEDDTSGMSFAEMFRHYLAPEVAKLPSSFSLPPLPPLPSTIDDDAHPFSLDAPENSAPQDSYPLSAFMPIIPGSPIGQFSPASASGNGGSPLSFGDMEDDNMGGMGGNDWAIDPHFLGGAEEQQENLFATIDDQAVVSPPTITFAPLLALPSLPEAVEPDVIVKTEPTPPTYNSRSVSASIAEEDEEMSGSDDEQSDEEPTSKRGRRSSSSSNGKKPKTSVSAFATSTLHATSSRSTLPP